MSDFAKRAAVLVLSLLAGMSGSLRAMDSPVGPNVRVNDPQQPLPNDFPTRSSISIAVSEDGQQLLAGFEDYRGLCGPPFNAPCPPENPSGLSGFAFSVDGGRTWTDSGALPLVDGAQTVGHPSLDVLVRGGAGVPAGARGRETFLYASRLHDAVTGAPLGASIHRGHFAGGSFVLDDAQTLNPPSVNAAFTRQAIATAKDGSGAAYLVESDLIGICDVPFTGFGQIEVWRTKDGGDTWQGPVVVSPEGAAITDPANPDCGSTGFLQVASDIAVGPEGQVYLVWQHGPELDSSGEFSPLATIAFSRSLDGGRTFEPLRHLADINSNQFNQPVAYAKTRMNDQARITVAMSGKHRGRVYVAYYQPVAPVSTPVTFQSLVSTQSYLVYSDDQGLTWSKPQPLGPPVPPTGLKRFWPTISVRSGGDVEIAYLESQEIQLNPDPTVVECSVQTGAGLRTGPAVSLIDTFTIQSQDGGVTFGRPLRVSSQSGNWCNITFTFFPALLSNLGDYIGVKSAGDRTFVAWPDARNGFADVFFAAVQHEGDDR